jgi:hypothetical protein
MVQWPSGAKNRQHGVAGAALAALAALAATLAAAALAAALAAATLTATIAAAPVTATIATSLRAQLRPAWYRCVPRCLWLLALVVMGRLLFCSCRGRMRR